MGSHDENLLDVNLRATIAGRSVSKNPPATSSWSDEGRGNDRSLIAETEADPQRFHRGGKMKFGGRGREGNRTTVIRGGIITMDDLPPEACDHLVGGRPEPEWVTDRRVVGNYKSGRMVHDANDLADETVGNPRYPPGVSHEYRCRGLPWPSVSVSVFRKPCTEDPSMENTTSFQYLTESVTDPRQQAKVMYPLDEILLLCLCGTVSSCETFVDIALYGEEKLEFLRRLAPFRNGIPSHDTLSAVFRALDPQEFSVAFSRWAAGLAGRIEGATVAIDGKTARGSATGGETPLHMISAWCDDLRIVLGQRVCGHGKNEIMDTSPSFWTCSRSRERR